MEKYTQMTFKMGPMLPNYFQIFASSHLCKLVEDNYRYRNNFKIIRCENNNTQRQQIPKIFKHQIFILPFFFLSIFMW